MRTAAKVMSVIAIFLVACAFFSAWVMDQVHEVYVEHIEDMKK